MKQDELERVIQYWEGYLGGMRCVSNIDSAEIFATLPPDLQAVALEMYKILDKSPEASMAVVQFLSHAIEPLIEKFIADLRSLVTN